MNQEQPAGVEDIWGKKIKERITEILKSIERERDYNPEDIDEEEIISTLVSEFNNLFGNHILSKDHEDHIARESFFSTFELKIRRIIIKKAEARISAKVANTMREFNEIKERIHGKDGKDKKIPEIPQAA